MQLAREQRDMVANIVLTGCYCQARQFPRADPEEAANEIFLKVTTNLERMPRCRHLENYVRRTTRFEARRFFGRQQKHRPVSLHGCPETAIRSRIPEEPVRDIGDQLANAEIMEMVRRYLWELPDQMQKVLVVRYDLRDWAGVDAMLPGTIADLAVLWGTSRQTLYNLHDRALHRLRWRLSGGSITRED